MYMSSKCLASGPGGESEAPQAASGPTTVSTAITRIFERERIGWRPAYYGRHRRATIWAMTALLAVDVGNTNTVVGVFRDGELAAHWRIQTVAERTSDEYAVLLKTLLDMEGF